MDHDELSVRLLLLESNPRAGVFTIKVPEYGSAAVSYLSRPPTFLQLRVMAAPMSMPNWHLGEQHGRVNVNALSSHVS